MRFLALGAALATVCSVATATTGGEVAGLATALRGLEAALLRQAAVVDGQLARTAPVSGFEDLFPAFGFAPRPNYAQLGLRAVDFSRTAICVSVRLHTATDWSALVGLLATNGYVPATSQCEPAIAALFPLPRNSPVLHAVKVVDRRMAPTPTRQVGEPRVIALPDRNTRPAFELSASAPRALLVNNESSVYAGTCDERPDAPADLLSIINARCDDVLPVQRASTAVTAEHVMSLTETDTDPSLSVTSQGCDALHAGASCSLTLSYAGGQDRAFKSVRLVWSKSPRVTVGGTIFGGTALLSGFTRIGVLGRTN